MGHRDVEEQNRETETNFFLDTECVRLPSRGVETPTGHTNLDANNKVKCERQKHIEGVSSRGLKNTTQRRRWEKERIRVRTKESSDNWLPGRKEGMSWKGT